MKFKYSRIFTWSLEYSTRDAPERVGLADRLRLVQQPLKSLETEKPRHVHHHLGFVLLQPEPAKCLWQLKTQK